jgi:kynureninase
MSLALEGSRGWAEEMDHNDPLQEYRSCFHIPGTQHGGECVYLCGHSLGLQPRSVEQYIEDLLGDWKRLAVRGHSSAEVPWIRYESTMREHVSKLVEAEPDEVVLMNSTTVNLHLALVSFYRPDSTRHKIVIEKSAFPSDRYAVESQIRFHGFDPSASLVEVPPARGEIVTTEDILATIERESKAGAVVLIGGVHYLTGQAFDLKEIVDIGHRNNWIVGFDLSHAVGNVTLRLHDWEADFAVWCGYKYLNGGPGSVAGMFVHRRFARRADLPRLVGWWGCDEAVRFQMKPAFQLATGASGWQISNPPIMALAPLRASLEIFATARMEQLRKKSVLLTGYLEDLLNRRFDFCSILTPSDPERRGAQISIALNDAANVVAKLGKRGVVIDCRQPNIVRVAPVPLYNTFTDVFRFVEALCQIDALAHA